MFIRENCTRKFCCVEGVVRSEQYVRLSGLTSHPLEGDQVRAKPKRARLVLVTGWIGFPYLSGLCCQEGFLRQEADRWHV